MVPHSNSGCFSSRKNGGTKIGKDNTSFTHLDIRQITTDIYLHINLHYSLNSLIDFQNNLFV
jgi:hypothetical protein